MDAAVEDAKAKKKHNGLLVLASARGYLADTLISRRRTHPTAAEVDQRYRGQKVQQLLEMGADIGAKDKRGISALHYASGQGRLEVLQFLWSKGLELDADDPGGRTALHWAVLGNHAEAVSFLVQKGAWVEASDGNDETALHVAARGASLEVVKALLAAGPRGRHPSIKDVNKRGLTPLGEALVAGRCDVADQLAQEGGACVDVRPHGWSLQHITAALGSSKSLQWLLRHKLAVNDADNEEGLTPLHCAAVGSSAQCAQLLLDAKADRNAVDREGRTPCDHAPESAQKLRALLKPSSAAAQKMPGAMQPSSNGNAAKEQTVSQAFAALSAAAQDAQVTRWAAMEDEAKLGKALAGHNAEVTPRVKDVQTTRQVLAIQNAINDLHEDEDFQQDAGQSHILGVVDEIRSNSAAMTKYEKDATVMHVLQKLRRFQMVVSANGHHKVPFVDLIVDGKVGWREKDQNRVRGMRIMLERQTRAAGAAASADNEDAAKAAAEAQLLPPQAAGADPEEAAPSGGAGAAASSSAIAGTTETPASASSIGAAERTASGDIARAGKPKKRVSWRAGRLNDVAQASADRAGLATPEELQQQELGERFTWKAFGRALLKQLLQSAMMGGVFLIAMYFSGQKMPWQTNGGGV